MQYEDLITDAELLEDNAELDHDQVQPIMVMLNGLDSYGQELVQILKIVSTYVSQSKVI